MNQQDIKQVYAALREARFYMDPSLPNGSPLDNYLRLSDSTGFQLPGDVLSEARADDARHKNTIPRRLHEVKDHRRFKAPIIPKKKGPDDENH
jgi:hypothetical protein